MPFYGARFALFLGTRWLRGDKSNLIGHPSPWYLMQTAPSSTYRNCRLAVPPPAAGSSCRQSPVGVFPMRVFFRNVSRWKQIAKIHSWRTTRQKCGERLDQDSKKRKPRAKYRGGARLGVRDGSRNLRRGIEEEVQESQEQTRPLFDSRISAAAGFSLQGKAQSNQRLR